MPSQGETRKAFMAQIYLVELCFNFVHVALLSMDAVEHP